MCVFFNVTLISGTYKYIIVKNISVLQLTLSWVLDISFLITVPVAGVKVIYTLLLCSKYVV